jgi:hypothetical protein
LSLRTPTRDAAEIAALRNLVPETDSVVTIDAYATAKVLMAITTLIVALSVATNLAGLDINRLDVDEEASVGTLWTVLQFGILIAALLARTVLARRAGEKWKPWLIVAMCAGYVMTDDAITIHEATTEPLRAALGTTGFLTFAWIIPYSIVAFVVIVTSFPWVRTLDPVTRSGMFLATGLFLTGAVLMEGVGGILIDAGGEASITDGAGFTSTMYMLSTSLEEFLEMISVAVAVAAVMFDLSKGGGFGLRIAPVKQPEPSSVGLGHLN